VATAKGGSKQVVRVLPSRQRIDLSKGREREQVERARADASSKPMMNDVLLSMALSKLEAAALFPWLLKEPEGARFGDINGRPKSPTQNLLIIFVTSNTFRATAFSTGASAKSGTDASPA
jgi:hypothetical protein